MVSATPPRSTEALTRGRIAAKPPSVPRKTPTKPERPAEPSELDSEEDSELSESESESEPESVPPPEQVLIRKKYFEGKNTTAAIYKAHPVYLVFCRQS